MNTGQSFLSLGAMTLESIIILQVNTGFVTTSSSLLDNKLDILAVSLASSIVEEASGKAFDAKTVTDVATGTGDLTSPCALGKGASESYPNLNDFDDFNGLEIKSKSMTSAEFDIKSEVCYVKSDSPNEKSSSPTWHKKITVYVTSKSMIDLEGNQDTVSLSSVFSYWHFR